MDKKDVLKDQAIDEGCELVVKDAEDEEMAAITSTRGGIEEKLSIEQILAGMTNEFNRSVVQNSSKSRDNTIVPFVKAIGRLTSITLQETETTATTTTTTTTTSTSSSSSSSPSSDPKRIMCFNEISNDLEQKPSTPPIVDDTTIVSRSMEKMENSSSTETAPEDEEEDDEAEEVEDDENETASKVAEDKKIVKPESIVKKDNNIPRIVLTFRTIDENTDYGRKTKISSCSSNLSLVPDELGNCDGIGGVSVKIENSDENSDNAEKSESEDCKNDGEQSKNKAEECKTDSEKQEKDSEEHKKDSEERNNEADAKIPKKDEAESVKVTETKASPSVEEDRAKENAEEESESKKTKVEGSTNKDGDVETVGEPVKQSDPEPPVTRKRRAGRTRLRVLSDSAEESPGPKRSARRLCKEPFRSTVLESAMARKEKSNYTQETSQWKRKAKPGRPRKTTKEQTKQSQSKVTAEVKNDVVLQNGDTNNSQTETNTTLDNSRLGSPESSVNETCQEETQNNSNADYDGMPKLSPMTKTNNSDGVQSRIGIGETNSISLTGNDEGSSSDIDKPFLKPAAGRTRRERGRPRGSGQAARKIAKTDSFEDGSPSIAETGKNNDYPEEYTVPVKRTRRSMAPSPSPAEGQASKPESTAIFSDSYEQTMKCLCQVRSQLYVTITGSGAPLYCTAIDSIDNRMIGCCNEVDSNDVAMRRPSTCVPFIILCRTHKERLLRHNCCPTCGLFCTQGKYVQCSNGHQFHRECETVINKKSACPHCSTDSTLNEIIVTMNGTRKPVYIPTRRKFSKLPSAKMSLPGKGDNTKLAERPPSPLVSPEDIKIPLTTSNPERPERYTIMSLHTSVKNGDLEKLVNVLACGYNANHTFREHSHRTGLHMAAEKGYLGCVHVLIQAGAQVDVMDKNQLTPLMLAATEGKTDVVKYLVRTGADVTLKGEDGMTALHMAAKSGHLDACRIILSECKVPRTLVDSVDDGGWTSLIWACEFCHSNVARFLLEKKCDPLIRDAEQNIALHWSAYSGSSEITEMLLNEGCDVNAVNVHGDTPLHIAARQDQYAVSVLLLARGAKVVEVNAAGETAVNCCINDGDTMAALRLNARVNELSEHMWEKTTRILTNDISRGKETNPIQCVNGYDTEEKPTDFLYVTENCFTSNINVDRTITSLQSCHCEDNCSSEKCLCGNISLRCWYDEEGKLVPEFNYTDPPMLFECNQACDCNRITCNNRVVQHGLTQRFQLFRTKGKGWGLRTLRHIPKGTYVCEYVGEIISDSEADHREDDSYLFDLDNRDGETYCIDARRYGNLARFINHSCAPNLLPVRVFVEHQDLHFPRIAFFANRDIDADEELGFDYGEKFWIIKCKSFTCTCGAENCRYSEKTIQVTLDNYRKKIQQEEILAAQML